MLTTHDVFQKAVTFQKKGQFAEAEELYRQLLAIQMDNSHVWHNLGTTLRKREFLDASLLCHMRAVESEPDNPAFQSSYGNCLRDLDRMEECLAAHAKAYKLAPQDIQIRKNYAIALREYGHHQEALNHFEELCRLEPGNYYHAWDRAVTYMYLGRLEEGWSGLESRWQHQEMKKYKITAPRWNGEDLKGKTLLIYGEQGFGDTILCSRYIPRINKNGGRVVLECKKQLHRLFSTIDGLDHMIDQGQDPGPHDYHIPMMSLPLIFKTTLQNIPPPARLSIPDQAPEGATKLLALGKDKFKVGIVWSGSVTFLANRKRAVTAKEFLPFAEIPGIQLYSLQKGPREEDLKLCGAEGLILELGPHLNDFADTAAVLKQLDLVIMTDSSVVHLAGSVGVPVWDLLNYYPYWLYLWDREDSPWYSSLRLFKQKYPGKWPEIFARVKKELEKIKSRSKPAVQ